MRSAQTYEPSHVLRLMESNGEQLTVTCGGVGQDVNDYPKTNLPLHEDEPIWQFENVQWLAFLLALQYFDCMS